MKKRLLAVLFSLAFLFTACSSQEEAENTEIKSDTSLITGTAFLETKGYLAQVKDNLSYEIFEYDVNLLTKKSTGVSISVKDSTTTFLHTFFHDNYIYIISSSIYNDSFITRINSENFSDIQTINLEETEYIFFDEDFDNVIFNRDKLYLVLSKTNFFGDSHTDYLSEFDFTTLEYQNLAKLHIDSFILTSYNENIYINSKEESLSSIYNYNTDLMELSRIVETLELSAMYKINETHLYQMNQGSTGITRKDMFTNEYLEVTLENAVPRSSLIGIYDNRVLFGYERLDEYLFFNMDLDDMSLTEMYAYYDEEKTIPPIIISELSDSFIVKLKDSDGNEYLALTEKRDYWNSREKYLLFSE